ncbi:MAG: hypothetical protein GY796_35990 [Chloroflexi bacterium]|nr:hypothetical protein [Chloroflexota bacterium]
MIVIERQIQKVHPEKWEELEELDKKYDVIESRLGYPPKKRCRCIVGGHDVNTLIVERQWESLAKMEAIIEKAFADPGFQGLQAELTTIVASVQFELYQPLP